jgi:hypothetical protein
MHENHTSFSTFANIFHVSEYIDQEKKQYVTFLKALSMNEEYSERKERADMHCTLKAIKFKKIDDEILAI